VNAGRWVANVFLSVLIVRLDWFHCWCEIEPCVYVCGLLET